MEANQVGDFRSIVYTDSKGTERIKFQKLVDDTWVDLGTLKEKHEVD